MPLKRTTRRLDVTRKRPDPQDELWLFKYPAQDGGAAFHRHIVLVSDKSMKLPLAHHELCRPGHVLEPDDQMSMALDDGGRRNVVWL